MTTPKPALGLLARLGTLLFSGVFAIAFGGGGVFFGIFPLLRTAQAAWAVQTWTPVDALVLSSRLDSRPSSETTSYLTQVRYRYSFGGSNHESERIGLDPALRADNIGDWQQSWHARLSTAQASGRTVTAWINPEDPSQSVLDPQIRWEMVLFHLPFAFVFTGVGAVACWVFVRTLLGRDASMPQSGADSSRNSASRGQPMLWFFALFWCGISFPLAGLFWLGGSPWWVKAFTSIFVAVGLGLLVVAFRQAALAWRFAGSGVQTHPSPPRAGESLELSVTLSARAVAAGRRSGLARRVRLAQYRVDDSGSGSSERRVEHFDRVASVVPDLQGGERWRARFEVPGDAPTHGGRRSRERVDWRLEILGEGDRVVVSYDVPVQTLPARVTSEPDAPDRFERRAAWNHEEPIPPVAGWGAAMRIDAAAGLPAGVTVIERADAWEMRFRQLGWRWAGALTLGAAVTLAGLWWQTRVGGVGPVAVGSGRWWGLALLLGFGLHAVSRWRSVAVRDDAVVVRVSSWMWSTTRRLQPGALDHVFHKLQYTQGGASGPAKEFRAVHARESDQGPSIRLTPGLAGAPAAVAVAQALQCAREHRQGRFSAGAARTGERPGWRPGPGWLLWALVLWALAAPPV